MTTDYKEHCCDWLDYIPDDDLPEIDEAFKASLMEELAPILKQRRFRYRRKVTLRILKVALPVIFLINPAIRLMQKATPLPSDVMAKAMIADKVPPVIPATFVLKVPVKIKVGLIKPVYHPYRIVNSDTVHIAPRAKVTGLEAESGATDHSWAVSVEIIKAATQNPESNMKSQGEGVENSLPK